MTTTRSCTSRSWCDNNDPEECAQGDHYRHSEILAPVAHPDLWVGAAVRIKPMQVVASAELYLCGDTGRVSTPQVDVAIDLLPAEARELARLLYEAADQAESALDGAL